MAVSSYRGPRPRRSPETVGSREAAVAKMYAAGLKHLHRPDDPYDPYHTTDAVLAWAERQVDDYIRRGLIVVSPEGAQ